MTTNIKITADKNTSVTFVVFQVNDTEEPVKATAWKVVPVQAGGSYDFTMPFQPNVRSTLRGSFSSQQTAENGCFYVVSENGGVPYINKDDSKRIPGVEGQFNVFARNNSSSVSSNDDMLGIQVLKGSSDEVVMSDKLYSGSISAFKIKPRLGVLWTTETTTIKEGTEFILKDYKTIDYFSLFNVKTNQIGKIVKIKYFLEGGVMKNSYTVDGNSPEVPGLSTIVTVNGTVQSQVNWDFLFMQPNGNEEIHALPKMTNVEWEAVPVNMKTGHQQVMVTVPFDVDLKATSVISSGINSSVIFKMKDGDVINVSLQSDGSPSLTKIRTNGPSASAVFNGTVQSTVSKLEAQSHNLILNAQKNGKSLFEIPIPIYPEVENIAIAPRIYLGWRYQQDEYDAEIKHQKWTPLEPSYILAENSKIYGIGLVDSNTRELAKHVEVTLSESQGGTGMEKYTIMTKVDGGPTLPASPVLPLLITYQSQPAASTKRQKRTCTFT